ncbi:hypothetical protein E3N88_06226 [Mikania micrantha]|uniref:Uncharacterized protein n=1 Tax=Mikania micrantha TaxID=192012 RepID=A0A5N6PQH6_9ASTR|nr:hypothetical protein E3N88_06226 [Mikania micrantha]
MPPRRRGRRNAGGAGDADAELLARINQTFNNMLPTIIDAVRNPNPNPNANANPNANENHVPVAGNNVGANQNVGIHVLKGLLGMCEESKINGVRLMK